MTIQVVVGWAGASAFRRDDVPAVVDKRSKDLTGGVAADSGLFDAHRTVVGENSAALYFSDVAFDDRVEDLKGTFGEYGTA